MSALQLRRVSCTLAVAAAVLVGGARQASAQFETPNRQFHNETSFPLDGRHRDLPCQSCHEDGVFQGTPNQCFDCHWVRRQDDRFRLQLGSECAQCHNTTAWSDTRWDHDAMTAMSLGVAHRLLSCQSCHRNDSFQAAQTDCVSCHLADYQATRTPDHLAAGFPTDCAACHRVSDPTFTQARFDHAATFPLVGVHAQQMCASCHTGGLYAGTTRACVGCHLDAYQRTTMPSHVMAGFSTSCQDCHSPTAPSWASGSGFDHSAVFPLVGVHAQQVCASCHSGGVYAGTPSECVGCHLDAYQRTSMPSHVMAGFSTSCQDCHSPSAPSWSSGGGFDHSAVFPLQGVHAQQACASCHTNGAYAGTPRDCAGCHLQAYNATSSPNHAATGFPTTCESCHRATDSSWTQGRFDHLFPITSGRHRTECVTCHQGGNFATFTCLVCHDHRRSAMDDHHSGVGGYLYDSLACYSCHPNGRH